LPGVRADDHTVDHTVRCPDMLPSHRWRQRNAENVVNLLDDTRHLWLDNDMTTNNTTNALAKKYGIAPNNLKK
jgi:hypothetical protein